MLHHGGLETSHACACSHPLQGTVVEARRGRFPKALAQQLGRAGVSGDTGLGGPALQPSSQQLRETGFERVSASLRQSLRWEGTGRVERSGACASPAPLPPACRSRRAWPSPGDGGPAPDPARRPQAHSRLTPAGQARGHLSP